MKNTLEFNSRIFWAKTKFFSFRFLSYFSFLLIPIWVSKAVNLHPLIQAVLLTLYAFFVCSQWFLLGKEIDHRFKIYFRVNSSIDRVIYRIFLGMFFFLLLFNLISLLNYKWINNSFWIVWSMLGLFYSWPTRGKIIQESVSSNFGEFRFLDSFEKTLLALILVTFVVTFPELPPLMNVDALKLYFDPMEKMGTPIWNFLTVNYFPFRPYPALFRLSWSIHFYFVQLGLFLFLFYALLRYFVSRRLSLLGVFALVSSWSFSKILVTNNDFVFLTTFSILWLWTNLWTAKSSTYRSGLFLGLVGYWATLINVSFYLMFLFQLCLIYFILLKDKNRWYKGQVLKYALFGIVLSTVYFLNHLDSLEWIDSMSLKVLAYFKQEYARKAFFSMSFIGVTMVIMKFFEDKWSHKYFKDIFIEKEHLKSLLVCLVSGLFFSIIVDPTFFIGFSTLWVLALLGLLPLEFIFQSLHRLRSRRNFIYLLYILICLLDSHFEGRVKLFVKIFFN